MDISKLNIIYTDDITLPELFVYTKASETQLFHLNEPDIGVFIAETANVIIRALLSGYPVVSMLVERQRLNAEAMPVFEMIEKTCGKEALYSIPVYVADHEVVKELTGYNLVRGLWAVLRRKKLQSVEEFCKSKSRIAVLYDVVNPTNVGAIMRSAAALGMDGCLLSEKSVNPLTRRSARVSMGTVFQIPWTVAGKGIDLISLLKGQGFECAAMALTKNSVPPNDDRIKNIPRLAVILGTEGTGLPEDIIDACDHRVMIPMYHGVDSLNVAAASAVIFWELSRSPGN